jgi:RNA polymerase sigma factor (TIGR02999 family)
MPDTGHITQLLGQAAAGDGAATAQLLPLVYEELRLIARQHLGRTPPGNTLQPTALVHEAYMRLVGSEGLGWENRRHFFGAAANVMRNILVDQARRKGAVKRGGGMGRKPLEEVELPIATPADDLLALDEALKELEKADPHQGEIVMLRYFAGLTVQETGAALGLSASTVEREWRFIRAFLHARVKGLRD